MANPYRGIVMLPAAAGAAGEARESMFPIFDAYNALRTDEEKDAFVRTVGRNMATETQRVLNEMFAAVPNRQVDALYAWGRANNRNIDAINEGNIRAYQRIERLGNRAADEITRGWVDTSRRGAGIPLDRVLPGGGGAGEPATGGRKRKTRRRHRRRTTRRRR
jgi:hypothetical protein